MARPSDKELAASLYLALGNLMTKGEWKNTATDQSDAFTEAVQAMQKAAAAHPEFGKLGG